MNESSAANTLLETDRAFSQRAQEIGVTAAFQQFAADDAVMYRNGMSPLVGKAAIQEVMEADPPSTLVWEPLSVDVAESGELGYTRGSFVYTVKSGPDGHPGSGPYKGFYISIWKKQADGTWKWVFDSGIISQMPPAPRQQPENS